MENIRRSSVAALLAVILAAPNLLAQSSNLTTTAVRGMTPVEYHRLRNAAIEAQANGEYQQAADMFALVAEAYPLDGENWARLGRNRLTIGDLQGALDPLKQAVALGVGWQGTLYTGFTQNAKVALARAFARLGETDSALVWLHDAIVNERYERPNFPQQDTAFRSLWGDKRFIALTGERDSALTRDAGWRKDIAYLADRMRHYNALYRYGKLPDSVSRFAEQLSSEVPRKSDTQIVLGLQRMLALLGQGHNMIYFWEPGPAFFASIPISFTQFQEGVYVSAAAPEFSHLVGQRVLTFNGYTPDQVLATGDTFFGNDHIENRTGGERFYRWPAALHAVALSKTPEHIELVTENAASEKTVLKVRAKTWDPPRKIRVPATATGPAPLWLSRPDEMFWTHRISPKTLYTQINNILNTQTESLAQFGMRLQTELDTSNVTNLIVDIRRNNGGNSYLYRELLRTLIAFDTKPDTKIYVLTDRMTYSAAMNFTTEVDRLTDAVFAGVAAAGVPIQIGGDAAEIVLPYSGIKAGVTSVIFQYTTPRDSRPYVAPDIPAPLKAADYFANRDTALQAVLQVIGN